MGICTVKAMPSPGKWDNVLFRQTAVLNQLCMNGDVFTRCTFNIPYSCLGRMDFREFLALEQRFPNVFEP